jgi:hypothetical protein
MPAIVSPRKTSSDWSRPLVAGVSSASIPFGLGVVLWIEVAIFCRNKIENTNTLPLIYTDNTDQEKDRMDR